MQPVTLLLATIGSETLQNTGPSWWQAVGALVAVLALLLICLRLLSRWQRPPGRDEAALVAVWPLGPRREIQIVRLRDEVHYVYRHEGGLVVLDRESWDRYRTAKVTARPASGPWQRLLHTVSGRPDTAGHSCATPPTG